jgi:hypothetical protein
MPQNKLKRNSHYNDSPALPGQPGYRTRSGRFGLDPLDTQAEAAYQEGFFYRRLFSFKFRTRNILHLCLMLFFGLIPFVLIMTGLIASILHGDSQNWLLIVGLFLPLLITGAIGINFILSIFSMAGLIDRPMDKRQVDKRKPSNKRKMQKRRKDYR